MSSIHHVLGSSRFRAKSPLWFRILVRIGKVISGVDRLTEVSASVGGQDRSQRRVVLSSKFYDEARNLETSGTSTYSKSKRFNTR